MQVADLDEEELLAAFGPVPGPGAASPLQPKDVLDTLACLEDRGSRLPYLMLIQLAESRLKRFPTTLNADGKAVAAFEDEFEPDAKRQRMVASSYAGPNSAPNACTSDSAAGDRHSGMPSMPLNVSGQAVPEAAGSNAVNGDMAGPSAVSATSIDQGCGVAQQPDTGACLCSKWSDVRQLSKATAQLSSLRLQDALHVQMAEKQLLLDLKQEALLHLMAAEVESECPSSDLESESSSHDSDSSQDVVPC